MKIVGKFLAKENNVGFENSHLDDVSQLFDYENNKIYIIACVIERKEERVQNSP